MIWDVCYQCFCGERIHAKADLTKQQEQKHLLQRINARCDGLDVGALTELVLAICRCSFLPGLNCTFSIWRPPRLFGKVSSKSHGRSIFWHFIFYRTKKSSRAKSYKYLKSFLRTLIGRYHSLVTTEAPTVNHPICWSFCSKIVCFVHCISVTLEASFNNLFVLLETNFLVR